MRDSLCDQHAAADLVFFDALEQRLEIAFAETFVALALDDLEEDRPDHGAGEDLQQDTFDRRAIDQDVQCLQPRERFTVSRHACMDARVIRSEEHTSELQSLMRTSYAVFCL